MFVFSFRSVTLWVVFRNAHRFKTGVLRFMQCVFLFSWIFINTDFIPDFVGKCLLIAGRQYDCEDSTVLECYPSVDVSLVVGCAA